MKHFTPCLSIFCIKLLGLFLAMSYSTTQLSGQIQRGQVYLGGSFKWTKVLDGYSHTDITVDPSLGIMLSPRWSGGFGVPFAYHIGYEHGLNNLYFAPFIRHYTPFNSNFHLITQFSARMNILSYRNKEMPNKYLFLQVTPLLNYIFGSRLALEANFGGFFYVRSKNYTAFNSFYSHTFQAEFKLFPTFTFRYYIPK